MTLSTDSPDQPAAPDLANDPYPYFNHMRKTSPVWRGTLMESDLCPRNSKSTENWVLFDFDSVFSAFRDDEVFGSQLYNTRSGWSSGRRSSACTASSITTIAAW